MPELLEVSEDLYWRVLKLHTSIAVLSERLRKSNSCHVPSGPKGGQFCETGGGGGVGSGRSTFIRSKPPTAATMSDEATKVLDVLEGTGKFSGIHTSKGVVVEGRGGGNNFFGFKINVEPAGKWKAEVSYGGSKSTIINRGKDSKAMKEFVSRWNVRGGSVKPDAAEARARRFEGAR